jgi:hypothetical protein
MGLIRRRQGEPASEGGLWKDTWLNGFRARAELALKPCFDIFATLSESQKAGIELINQCHILFAPQQSHLNRAVKPFGRSRVRELGLGLDEQISELVNGHLCKSLRVANGFKNPRERVGSAVKDQGNVLCCLLGLVGLVEVRGDMPLELGKEEGLAFLALELPEINVR